MTQESLFQEHVCCCAQLKRKTWRSEKKCKNLCSSSSSFMKAICSQDLKSPERKNLGIIKRICLLIIIKIGLLICRRICVLICIRICVLTIRISIFSHHLHQNLYFLSSSASESLSAHHQQQNLYLQDHHHHQNLDLLIIVTIIQEVHMSRSKQKEVQQH